MFAANGLGQKSEGFDFIAVFLLVLKEPEGGNIPVAS